MSYLFIYLVKLIRECGLDLSAEYIPYLNWTLLPNFRQVRTTTGFPWEQAAFRRQRREISVLRMLLKEWKSCTTHTQEPVTPALDSCVPGAEACSVLSRSLPVPMPTVGLSTVTLLGSDVPGVLQTVDAPLVWREDQALGYWSMSSWCPWTKSSNHLEPHFLQRIGCYQPCLPLG